MTERNLTQELLYTNYIDMEYGDDGEFFNYLQTDYVKYEEDMYYVRKEDL